MHREKQTEDGELKKTKIGGGSVKKGGVRGTTVVVRILLLPKNWKGTGHEGRVKWNKSIFGEGSCYGFGKGKKKRGK